MLRDIIREERRIAVNSTGANQEFTVHGLTLEDIAGLLTPHREVLDLLFTGKLPMQEMLIRFPLMCATIISYAADEPDEVENVRKLPLGIQVDAMDAVWAMTVVDEEEFAKKLRSLVYGMTRVMSQVGEQTPGNKINQTLKTLGTTGNSH